MKNEIYEIIVGDKQLRRKIADELEVLDSTVYKHCRRRAPKLSEHRVVEIIAGHLNVEPYKLFDNK